MKEVYDTILNRLKVLNHFSSDCDIRNILNDTKKTVEYLTVELNLLTYEEFLNIEEFIKNAKKNI